MTPTSSPDPGRRSLRPPQSHLPGPWRFGRGGGRHWPGTAPRPNATVPRATGVFRMPGYVSTLRSGWVDARAVPVVDDVAPGFPARRCPAMVSLNPPLAAAAPRAVTKARAAGACVVGLHASHHFGALWLDVEPFAEQGLVAIAVVNSMAVVVPPGGRRPVFGTNPMAFAAPRADTHPLVFDQAASTMAHGDVKIAAKGGHDLAPGVGVDRDGRPTRDPERHPGRRSSSAFRWPQGSIDRDDDRGAERRADRRPLLVRGGLVAPSRRPDALHGRMPDPDRPGQGGVHGAFHPPDRGPGRRNAGGRPGEAAGRTALCQPPAGRCATAFRSGPTPGPCCRASSERPLLSVPREWARGAWRGRAGAARSGGG